MEDDDFFGNRGESDDDDDDEHDKHKETILAKNANNNNGNYDSTVVKKKNGLGAYEACATEEKFRNLGYLEAYEESKVERLQEGFQDGYVQHSINGTAMRIGLLLGQASTKNALCRRQRKGRNNNNHLKKHGGEDDDDETYLVAAKMVRTFLLEEAGVANDETGRQEHLKQIDELEARLSAVVNNGTGDNR